MYRISRLLAVAAVMVLLCNLLSAFVTAADLTEGDYSYQINTSGDSVTITKYNGDDTAINVPSTLGGLPVTHIGDSAFSNNHVITSVKLPSSVTTIRSMAFYNCYALSNVEVTPYLVSVGNQAFQGTSWLSQSENGPVYLGRVLYTYAGTMPANTEITVRYGTASIAAYAFYGQVNLKAIYLPVGIRTVGSFAFGNCSSLLTARIPASVQRISSGAFLNAGNTTILGVNDSVAYTFAKNNSLLFKYDETLDYPDGDVNGDKLVNSRDLRLLMYMLLADETSLDEERVASCDFVYDGTIDSADVRAIFRVAVAA